MIGTMESYRDDFARIWMLSSENIVKCKRIIAKHSAWMFNLLQAHYFRLHNIIPVENTMTIKWLEMNGFMFGDTHIINDYEFVEFFRCNLEKNIIYNRHKPWMQSSQWRLSDGQTRTTKTMGILCYIIERIIFLPFFFFLLFYLPHRGVVVSFFLTYIFLQCNYYHAI